MNESNDLSDRELEILRLVATGASNKEIAQKLFISLNTVKVHLRNIFAKIGVATRTEAAMYAVNSGLVAQLGQGSLDDAQAAQEQISSGEKTLARRKFGIRFFWITGSIFVFLIILSVVMAFYIGRNVASTAQEGENLRWKVLAPMPTARYSLALVGYENRVYAFGGKTSTDVTGLVEYYDIAKGNWVRTTDKPVPVYEINAVVIGGRIFIPGGRLATGGVTDVLEIYDPRQDSWTRGASLPTPLSAYALVAYEGRMYLFGGWDGSSFVSLVYEYNPARDVWNRMQPMPTGRGYLGAAVAGQKIFLVGGYDGKRALKTNEVFKPDLDLNSNDTWSQVASLPYGIYAMGVVSVADIVYLVGGLQEGNDGQYPALQYYTQTDEWRTFNAPTTNLGAFIGLTNQGIDLYAIGGSINQQPINNNLVYKALYTVSFPIISR